MRVSILKPRAVTPLAKNPLQMYFSIVHVRNSLEGLDVIFYCLNLSPLTPTLIPAPQKVSDGVCTYTGRKGG